MAESLPSLYLNYFGNFCHLTDYDAAKEIEEAEKNKHHIDFVPCSDSVFNRISTANRIKDQQF
jgi:hypothetical protein